MTGGVGRGEARQSKQEGIEESGVGGLSDRRQGKARKAGRNEGKWRREGGWVTGGVGEGEARQGKQEVMEEGKSGGNGVGGWLQERLGLRGEVLGKEEKVDEVKEIKVGRNKKWRRWRGRLSELKGGTRPRREVGGKSKKVEEEK